MAKKHILLHIPLNNCLTNYLQPLFFASQTIYTSAHKQHYQPVKVFTPAKLKMMTGMVDTHKLEVGENG